MKKYVFPSYLLLILVLLVSCTNTTDRVRDFVAHYNAVAYGQFAPAFDKLNNRILARTYAATLPSKSEVALDVKIVFVSKFALKDSTKDLYTKFIPLAFTNYISTNKEAKYLISKGVKFKIIYASRTEKPISELIIDQSNLQELLKEQPGQNLQVGKENRNSGIRPEVKQMLITLNNSLPIIVDKQLQNKITKIDLNSLNDLVYTVEVGKEMQEVMKQKDAAKIMKADILKNPTIRSFYWRIKSLGLADIRYVYTSQSGKILSDIIIKQEDFK